MNIYISSIYIEIITLLLYNHYYRNIVKLHNNGTTMYKYSYREIRFRYK